MMSLTSLKAKFSDLPHIAESLSMQLLAGRQNYSVAGKLVSVDATATEDEAEAAIRAALSSTAIAQMPSGTPVVPASSSLLPPVTLHTQEKMTMTTTPAGGFAASIRSMMDEARANLEKSKTDGLAKVQQAIGKLNDAKAATEKVAGSMAQTIEDEAAAVLSELGQISNDIGVDGK